MYRLKTAFDSWDRLSFSHQDGIISRDADGDGDHMFTVSHGRLMSTSGELIHWAWKRNSGTVLGLCVYVEYVNATQTLFRLKIGLPDTYLRLDSGVLGIGEARQSPVCVLTKA